MNIHASVSMAKLSRGRNGISSSINCYDFFSQSRYKLYLYITPMHTFYVENSLITRYITLKSIQFAIKKTKVITIYLQVILCKFLLLQNMAFT